MNIKNIIHACFLAYTCKKEGADIKVNLKQHTMEIIGYGYHETIKL